MDVQLALWLPKFLVPLGDEMTRARDRSVNNVEFLDRFRTVK